VFNTTNARNTMIDETEEEERERIDKEFWEEENLQS